MTFAADSAKSIIFHQLRWTHILTTAKNQCRLCVCKIHMCLLFCIFMFMPVCVFVFIFKVYLCLTYTSITDWLKRHRGFNLATFTEQLMCSAQVRSADSALYLKPNTSLCLYYSFIPNIFLSFFFDWLLSHTRPGTLPCQWRDLFNTKSPCLPQINSNSTVSSC